MFRGPNGKEFETDKSQSDSSHNVNYKIVEVSDSVIVFEEVMGGAFGIERMRRTEKLELLNIE
ncbi:MAG: hypothetical protein ACK5RG_20240 [Cyclobacteriaceae bacterium]|nr:hypothetical protein [Flammeovirgaceae bacterium]